MKRSLIFTIFLLTIILNTKAQKADTLFFSQKEVVNLITTEAYLQHSTNFVVDLNDHVNINGIIFHKVEVKGNSIILMNEQKETFSLVYKNHSLELSNLEKTIVETYYMN